MAMFRVYTRRATTKPPVWDWMQAVSSKTAGDALNSAYQSCVDNSPYSANGGKQVDPTHFVTSYTPSQVPSANQLIGGLDTTKNAVNVAVSLGNFSANSSQMSVSG